MFKKTKSSLAVTLSVAMLATMVSIPSVASAATAKPLSGADRYETALKIVQDGWTSSMDAVIASGETKNMPDALSAAPLAYAKGKAPILLTKTNSISAEVLKELKDLGVKNVYIVGGVGAVSASAEKQLSDAGLTIKRVSGKDRFETSLAIAKEAFGTTPAEVVIANGMGYADALSISAIAAERKMPILLVSNSALTTEQSSYIAGKTVYAVGGTGVLNATMVSAANATRLSGLDRYDTNAAILAKFKTDFTKIYLAKGTDANLVDALAGSVLAAKTNSPIVLVDGNNKIAASLATVVKANITAASTEVLLGGTVTQTAADAVEALKPQELAIKSISATNSRDIVVNFNGAVDEITAGVKSNYEVKVNNSATAINAANYTVEIDSDDTSKVMINLATGSALKNGDFVTVKVLKAVSNSALKPMAADTTIALPVFSDTIAPTIAKVETAGNDVVITFDDYITAPTDLSSVVKFNGSRILASGYTLSDKTLTLTGANNPSLAAGSYDLTLSNVNDLNANNATFLMKTLTVTNDFTVPAFVSVKAKATNVMSLKFNKSLAIAPTVTVKKNGYTLLNTVAVDATDSTIYNVTVADNGLVKVYNSSENSTALEVSVSGIKDTKNTIGSAINTNVTLVKDTTAPTVIVGNSSITGNNINVQLNEALQNADVTKVIITDKDGIRITGVAASITNDARYGANTVLTLTKTALADGAYTISIASGAVEDTSENPVAGTTLALTKSAASSSDLTGISVNTYTPNVITVNYGADMSDAARSAANYTLDGKMLPTGSILYFLNDKKTVIIELPTASVSKTVAYTLGFNGAILTTGGAKIASAEKNKIVTLTDNVKPLLVSAKKLTSTTVELTLSEVLAAVDAPALPAVSTWLNDFVVKVNGVDLTVTGIVAGATADKLVLTVSAYNVDQALTVTVGGTDITLNAKDTSSNVITSGTVVTATK